MPLALRVFFGFLAVSVAGIALAANASFYGAAFATDEKSRWTYTAIAVATCLIKLTIPAGLSYVVGHRTLRGFAWLVIASAVAFDVMGAVGYMNQTRGVKIEGKGLEARKYNDKAEEVRRLKERADAYKDRRPTAVVEAERARALALAGGCTARQAHVERCAAPGILDIELAESKERDKRQAAYELAAKQFQNLTTPAGSADPQGDAFSSITGKIGVGDGGFFVTVIFSVLIIILFEVAPPVAAFLALYRIPSAKEAAAGERAPRKPVHKEPAQPAKRPDVAAGLEALLHGSAAGLSIDAAARRVEGSQSAMAKALGLSAAKVNRELKALAAAGRLTVTAGAGGTVIILR